MLDIIVNRKTSDLLKKGFPWVYDTDIFNKNSSLKMADSGELCNILDEKGKKLAIGYFNNKTNIAVRVLSFNVKENINEDFFRDRLRKALERRFKYFDEGFFRMVYSESDNLPGLIIDVYGEYAVVQANSAGMDNLKKYWLPALTKLMGIKGVYFDGSSKHRSREGLENKSEVIYGTVPNEIKVRENGITYFANLFDGQKTGWFYDQRDNREFLASIAGDKSVLDLYTHSGGFGLLCSANGAAMVDLVDRSALGLELCDKAIQENDLKNCVTVKDEVFDFLDNEIRKFDIVNADPPAFAKSRKDIEVGLKGYEKLIKKCIRLVDEGGIFALSSCSFFVRPQQFQIMVEKVLMASGRKFELLRRSGADKDHPIHPMLGETNYLKFLVYKLD